MCKPNAKIAHISEDGNRVQTVAEHLLGTSRLAAEYADEFHAAGQGRLAGLLHDIGKYSEAFQRRILQGGPKVDHSTAGAQVAFTKNQYYIAFAVAGHHAGIPDGGHKADSGDDSTLFGRKKKLVEPYEEWEEEVVLPNAPLPAWMGKDCLTDAFYTRMLYSCLVDADFLDTESFMRGSPAPRGHGESLENLLSKVHKKAEQFLQQSSVSSVAEQRNGVLRACMERGKNWQQGLYTLTVPTGGGKTFASLIFALEHAVAQNKKRVIYVIPYTSIIDQTARVFAELLGEDNVLAHYANAEYRLKNEEDLTPGEYKHLLATENWDAPVIVTTAVQFFESFYSNRSSRCRKLHNVANSVLIFDEAQTIPCDVLYPCVSVIDQLVQHYRVTAVLCTATQPALQPIFDNLKSGVRSQEISPDPELLYKTLQRVTFCDRSTLQDSDLKSLLSSSSQVLCIVNRRKTAQELYAALPEEGSYCLTTLLCAVDRRNQIVEIRKRLEDGLPCRVISTSLIEAGVDVDFPVVYREQCGLDSLLQAAGRCNREGKRSAQESKVYRFSLKDTPAPKMLNQGISALGYTLRQYDNLNTPEAIHCYFNELFYKIKDEHALDRKEILSAFKKGIKGCCFPFAQVADLFKMIEAPTKNIYVPIGEGKELCDSLQQGFVSRVILRRLGMYSVACYEQQFNALNDAGALDILESGDAVLIDLSHYNHHTGLDMNARTGEAFII